MNDQTRKFSIGRDRTCDIPVADESVSGRHAELTFLDGGKLLLTDCNSTNGTRLLLSDGREQRIRHEFVSPMDRVKLGGVVLSIKDLLEALRLKYPQFGSQFPGAERPPAEPPVQGRQLVRCVCGLIKPAGKPCPGCGR
ncbi:FHA domain-containing protein [Thiohalocapsa marina]|nr:FHA domain-containing protein [Thiohalocapsa marina]